MEADYGPLGRRCLCCWGYADAKRILEEEAKESELESEPARDATQGTS